MVFLWRIWATNPSATVNQPNPKLVRSPATGWTIGAPGCVKPRRSERHMMTALRSVGKTDKCTGVSTADIRGIFRCSHPCLRDVPMYRRQHSWFTSLIQPEFDLALEIYVQMFGCSLEMNLDVMRCHYLVCYSKWWNGMVACRRCWLVGWIYLVCVDTHSYGWWGYPIKFVEWNFFQAPNFVYKCWG